MRIPRIHHPELLPSQGKVNLSDDAANHVGRVMRMKEGESVLLFDGSGAEFPAVITSASKKRVLKWKSLSVLSVAANHHLTYI